jgi:hypothetical protein
MTLILALRGSGEPALVEAQVAFHLQAGADLVLAAVDESDEPVRSVLAAYEDAGFVKLVTGSKSEGPATPTTLARLAAGEHGADWVISCAPGEFWWPRGVSLGDVLAPIPPRYTIVQALRRFIVAGERGERDLVGERVATVLNETEHRAKPGALLRPVHRGDPAVVVRDDGSVALPGGVPLRAWYPIEAFQLSVTAPQAEDGAPETDSRLRDALRTLSRDAHAGSGGVRRFVMPGEGAELSFRTPDIVEDARYAAECAAVGEVDLAALERCIDELEERVAFLERGIWPRLLRAGSRVAGRRSG